MDSQHGPCERLIQCESALTELTRWQARQNGAVSKMADRVDAIGLDIATLSANYGQLVRGMDDINEQMRWNRRIMYGTIVAVFASIAGKTFGVM